MMHDTKNYTFFFRKAMLMALLLIAAHTTCFSQGISKPVLKKFIQRDSGSVNNDAVLVLYRDSSFVNYGILKDLKNQEVYVWYTFGKWSQGNTQITCNTRGDVFNKKSMIDHIKVSYRKRIDYRMIESYYEFVSEPYTNARFALTQSGVMDQSKNIEYIELKEDTSKTN